MITYFLRRNLKVCGCTNHLKSNTLTQKIEVLGKELKCDKMLYHSLEDTHIIVLNDQWKYNVI